MALVTIGLHGRILQPGGLTPAVGTVRLRILHELRDAVGNIVYSPDTFTATLDVNGEFTIAAVPTTDNPDIIPASWAYEVWVDTDVWRQLFYAQLPAALGPVAEFSDLPVVAYDPCAAAISPFGTGGVTAGSFLPLSGGTISGNLTVTGTTTIRHGAGFSIDAGEALATVVSTGLVAGGAITANLATPSSLDIAGLIAYFVDANSNQFAPTFKRLALGAQTVPMDAGALARPVTWWLLASDGSIVQQAFRETEAQRRTHVTLGASIQVAGAIVETETVPSNINAQPGPQFVDLLASLGPFVAGNSQRITPNGVNLMVDASGGMLISRGLGYETGGVYPPDPHRYPLVGGTPASFWRATRNNPLLSGPHTTVDVANYDVGGVVTPIGGGAGTSSIIRVWTLAAPNTTQQIVMQYGQATYNSLTAALDAVSSAGYVTNPNFIDGAALVAHIVATRTATNLSDPAQARILRARKFETS